MRITVLSTFDIWPPKDGGQSRYYNLWRNFSKTNDIKIVAYDFRCLSSDRNYRIDDHLEVIVPRALASDAAHFYHMLERTSLWLHDALCHRDYLFSDEFMKVLHDCTKQSDVIVASHPYLAGLAFPHALANATLVYESYNVERDIKEDYFNTGKDQDLLRELLQSVGQAERFAASHAHIVTAVSDDDRRRLIELYGLPPKIVRVVPNGANVRSADLMTEEERQAFRSMLHLAKEDVGIFLGSSFGPNVESYRRIREMLHDGGFRGTILLVGSIANAPRYGWPRVNFDERWFGFVDDAVRDALLGCADFALQLIFAGAGTNLKLFDYMGAGVPIIANEFGRRGVDGEGWYWAAENSSELSEAIAGIRLLRDDARIRANHARAVARSRFDWAKIASTFEDILRGARTGLTQ